MLLVDRWFKKTKPYTLWGIGLRSGPDLGSLGRVLERDNVLVVLGLSLVVLLPRLPQLDRPERGSGDGNDANDLCGAGVIHGESLQTGGLLDLDLRFRRGNEGLDLGLGHCNSFGSGWTISLCALFLSRIWSAPKAPSRIARGL